MPVKAPRPQRARIGEERSPGEVRPVTNRTIVGLGIGVLVLVDPGDDAPSCGPARARKKRVTTGHQPAPGRDHDVRGLV